MRLPHLFVLFLCALPVSVVSTSAAEVGRTILSGAAVPAQTGLSAPRPNIVFLFADDMGWGDLGR